MTIQKPKAVYNRNRGRLFKKPRRKAQQRYEHDLEEENRNSCNMLSEPSSSAPTPTCDHPGTHNLPVASSPKDNLTGAFAAQNKQFATKDKQLAMKDEQIKKLRRAKKTAVQRAKRHECAAQRKCTKAEERVDAMKVEIAAMREAMIRMKPESNASTANTTAPPPHAEH